MKKKPKINLQNVVNVLSEALPAHTLSVPAPRSVIFQPTTVAVSVFFAAPDTGQMHIQFSFEICPCPKGNKKRVMIADL